MASDGYRASPEQHYILDDAINGRLKEALETKCLSPSLSAQLKQYIDRRLSLENALSQNHSFMQGSASQAEGSEGTAAHNTISNNTKPCLIPYSILKQVSAEMLQAAPDATTIRPSSPAYPYYIHNLLFGAMLHNEKHFETTGQVPKEYAEKEYERMTKSVRGSDSDVKALDSLDAMNDPRNDMRIVITLGNMMMSIIASGVAGWICAPRLVGYGPDAVTGRLLVALTTAFVVLIAEAWMFWRYLETATTTATTASKKKIVKPKIWNRKGSGIGDKFPYLNNKLMEVSNEETKKKI